MLARTADELGLDLVSVQDHPYNATHLDTWTLLSVIAASTRSVRVFPNVANLPLRPPAVLARSAASLDVLSGGRVELGIGAGAFWDAIAAMDGPRRTPAESVEALAEAIDVIRALWTPGRSARLRRQALPLERRAPRPVSRAPHRDLARRLRPADAAAHRPAGRRVAAERAVRAVRRSCRR